MIEQDKIQFFENKTIRTAWDGAQEEWYFCVIDVIEALTGSTNPTDYLKKCVNAMNSSQSTWGQIVPR